MEDPYEDSVIIVDPDSSTVTAQDPDYVAPAPKTRVIHIQGSVKRFALGCVNSPPSARGSQESGFTQPKAHLLADPCTYNSGPSGTVPLRVFAGEMGVVLSAARLRF